MKVLKRTQFGNPVLRQVAREVSVAEIAGDEIQALIADMRHTLISKKLGVALAAPQVGKSIRLVVVGIRPTPLRPDIEAFDLVLINPVITERIGRRKSMWEGCISAGSRGEADLFAKVPRYNRVKISYYDENGSKQHKSFEGLKAQIMQHEIDHLDGTLFVDHVKDSKTFMTYKEYIVMVKRDVANKKS